MVFRNFVVTSLSPLILPLSLSSPSLMKQFLLFSLLAAGSLTLSAQRSIRSLEADWTFHRGEAVGAQSPQYDDSKWERVSVPHDWAIKGPFDRKYDLQVVAVTQNGETEATEKTGRTGGLPYIGVGWYRQTFAATPGRKVSLVFDGAMSEARVFVNGKEAAFWPLGYNSFHCDVTDLVRTDGGKNILAVRLENLPESSRWYPGAGLYRHVRVVETADVHVPVWGTQITTPHVTDEYASVVLKTKVEGAEGKLLTFVTTLYDADGKAVAEKRNQGYIAHGQPFQQNFTLPRPLLWSPETPHLYRAVSKIYDGNRLCDTYETRFGVRTLAFVPDKGFYLNGRHRKFQGVCNHHDLGPLGAAINISALRHQLAMLKNMGCDAIRTAHNMPAPELVALCEEMGFMMMLEPFDEWEIAKCKNGYHRFFNEWAERDMLNMLHQYRNSPAVVMWSIGNEVPTQCSAEGYKVATMLRDICHREDPTRPVTCGMDQVSCVLDNGFAAIMDIPGFNYRAHRYTEAYGRLPQNLVLGSETSSTVSSRGVYKFPVKKKADALYPDHQSSGYDTEYCSWSNTPDVDFALADDFPWTLGQFVWTGFDYLGEPSPYDTDAWPSHSSLFGIIDLASLPKDRYYLYRSVWNKTDKTLHVLPHWTWPGREGEPTPVYVYTNYAEAELFVNGVSQGRLRHAPKPAPSADNPDPATITDGSLEARYRLMWNEVKYEPGEIRVVAYDEHGRAAEERRVRTAGKPHRILLRQSRYDGVKGLKADGKDLAYITVSVVDKDGNLCPEATNMVRFSVKGAGTYKAAANGNAASLALFHLPQMPVFAGQCTAIVQAGRKSGRLVLEATAQGLKKATLTIEVN